MVTDVNTMGSFKINVKARVHCFAKIMLYNKILMKVKIRCDNGAGNISRQTWQVVIAKLGAIAASCLVHCHQDPEGFEHACLHGLACLHIP